MIYIRISSEQGSKFRVDDPCNLRMWMRFTKRCNCGQRMNDVTEGARLDDQDRFRTQVASFAKASAAREALKRLSVEAQLHPISQSPVAPPGAAADLLQQSSFGRPPGHILRETVGPGYSPYRKCSTLRASFHHAVAPHCPC